MATLALRHVDLLRQEIAILRAENDRKDAVIHDLTQRLAHDQQSHEQTLQESLSDYQQEQRVE